MKESPEGLADGEGEAAPRRRDPAHLARDGLDLLRHRGRPHRPRRPRRPPDLPVGRDRHGPARLVPDARSAARRARGAARRANLRFVHADDAAGTLAYVRRTDEEAAVVVLNLGEEERTVDVPLAGVLPASAILADALGESSLTVGDAPISVTVPAQGVAVLVTEPGTDLAGPDAAGGVSASGGGGPVEVGWDEVEGAAGYEVWRSIVPGGGYELVGKGTEPAFSDATVRPGTRYYYVVRRASTRPATRRPARPRRPHCPSSRSRTRASTSRPRSASRSPRSIPGAPIRAARPGRRHRCPRPRRRDSGPARGRACPRRPGDRLRVGGDDLRGRRRRRRPSRRRRPARGERDVQRRPPRVDQRRSRLGVRRPRRDRDRRRHAVGLPARPGGHARDDAGGRHGGAACAVGPHRGDRRRLLADPRLGRGDGRRTSTATRSAAGPRRAARSRRSARRSSRGSPTTRSPPARRTCTSSSRSTRASIARPPRRRRARRPRPGTSR